MNLEGAKEIAAAELDREDERCGEGAAKEDNPGRE